MSNLAESKPARQSEIPAVMAALEYEIDHLAEEFDKLLGRTESVRNLSVTDPQEDPDTPQAVRQTGLGSQLHHQVTRIRDIASSINRLHREIEL